MVFQPIVDLDTGTVIAVETHPAPAAEGASARFDPSDEDVRRAVLAARLTSDVGTRLPLQITVKMETLARGHDALMPLHQGLLETGRRPNEILVCVTGGFSPAHRTQVSTSLRDLRKAGYLIGFTGLGTAHTPLDLLVDDTPYLVKLDPELARRASSDDRRSALAEALLRLSRKMGTHVLAPGLATERQLVHLRGLGVRLVQGPLLAPPDWHPGMGVTVPVLPRESVPEPREDAGLGARVSEFTLPAVTMPDTATADDVLTALNAERGTTSVVLVDKHQRPKHTVDRTRFLLAVSGPYGHALHAHKPAARLADPPRLVPRTVPAIAALRAAGKESERVYDDLVVTDEVGRCLGIVRVGDLIRSLSP
ncbi:EAL domain-containing protein [Actinomadura sp. HBU206391]|uniref:EAL domain-containing protein n=1 Tax=Actinomadura sp. HBU206391 TaxID=2731692 RepID=UPI001650343C|nr:EAL domain-containing protein [Actinomadura sp. HBU206391]MBC6463099.1 EAL domain-containing protein [Actinomadura sp. HBU206391]